MRRGGEEATEEKEEEEEKAAGAEAAGAELKTKNPHNDVGKNLLNMAH